MKKFLSILPRWIPALLVMALIFLFSSRASSQLPNFLSWDYVIKKTAHIIVYAMLALAYFSALRFNSKYRWVAWALAILYATTDELHQSFVPGRHPSIWDVLVFDNIGAIAALWFHSSFINKHNK